MTIICDTCAEEHMNELDVYALHMGVRTTHFCGDVCMARYVGRSVVSDKLSEIFYEVKRRTGEMGGQDACVSCRGESVNSLCVNGDRWYVCTLRCALDFAVYNFIEGWEMEDAEEFVRTVSTSETRLY